MSRIRQIITAFVCFLFVLASSGCENALQNNTTPKKEPINLIYYTIGNPDPDLPEVNEALNELLAEKIGVTITYNKIAWADYGERLAAIIRSGAYFDVAFCSTPTQGDFIGNAQRGVWMPLEGYLETSASEMYEAIHPFYWDAVTLNGHIYGIPTNKETCVLEMFMFAKDLVDKYQIDISRYQTIESLAPILDIVAKNEPDYIPFEFDTNARNLFAQDGYETLLGHLPLMVNSLDESCTVVNILETPLGESRLNTMRNYYTKGYINEDAAIKESGSLVKDERVFCKISSGGPYSEVLWSADRGYDIVTQEISPKVMTTESARGGIMCVNAKTIHPIESVEFLNCLNTDPEVRNMINFGIEGKHYTLTDKGQVHRISNDYSGVQYTQGNWFILKTLEGEPLNKWDVFRDFNESVKKSQTLGFTVDPTPFASELEAAERVCDQYYSSLMTGSVDIQTYLPKYLEDLRAAGIDKIQRIVQDQLSSWKKQQSQ